MKHEIIANVVLLVTIIVGIGVAITLNTRKSNAKQHWYYVTTLKPSTENGRWESCRSYFQTNVALTPAIVENQLTNIKAHNHALMSVGELK